MSWLCKTGGCARPGGVRDVDVCRRAGDRRRRPGTLVVAIVLRRAGRAADWPVAAWNVITAPGPRADWTSATVSWHCAAAIRGPYCCRVMRPTACCGRGSPRTRCRLSIRCQSDERQILRRWIDEGLKWDGDHIDPLRYTTDRRAGYDWWSLQPLAKSQPPEVKTGMATQRNRSVHPTATRTGRLAALGPGKPSRTLVRRLFYDLIGLPPTPQQVRSFVADPSDAAYERMVDDLLASPHYGERWGRHWLDVVRFGESDGFERNAPREQLWHYRDWVIQAFNDDLPYRSLSGSNWPAICYSQASRAAAAVAFWCRVCTTPSSAPVNG